MKTIKHLKQLNIQLHLDDGSCQMKGALWKLPELKEYTNDVESLKKLADIDTTPHGTDLKTIAYHPMDSTKAVSVVDNKFILWDLTDNGPQVKTDFCIICRYIFYLLFYLGYYFWYFS